MAKKNKSRRQLSFHEVGISINGREFYVSFAVPQGLVMRSYSVKSQAVQPIQLTDWLVSDFPVILGRRLMAKPGVEIKLICHNPLLPFRRDELGAIYPANSLPDSWIIPFVHLFASEFVNSLPDVS